MARKVPSLVSRASSKFKLPVALSRYDELPVQTVQSTIVLSQQDERDEGGVRWKNKHTKVFVNHKKKLILLKCIERENVKKK